MSEFPLSYLFQENTSLGFPGNNLTEDIFNAMIDQFILAAPFQTEGYDVGNGVTFHYRDYDENSDFTQLEIEARLKAYNTPFYPDVEKLNYTNNKIQFVDVNSDFAVYSQIGTMIDPANFTVSENGVITFNQARTDNFILVSGLVYIVKTIITLTRDQNGAIEAISVEKVTN